MGKLSKIVKKNLLLPDKIAKAKKIKIYLKKYKIKRTNFHTKKAIKKNK